MEKLFKEGFVYSEGDKVNVIDYLKVTNDEAKGKHFKTWGVENNLFEDDTIIEHEGRSYYLLDYKEKNKKIVDFSNYEVMSVMSNPRRTGRCTSAATPSIASTSIKSECVTSPAKLSMKK